MKVFLQQPLYYIYCLFRNFYSFSAIILSYFNLFSLKLLLKVPINAKVGLHFIKLKNKPFFKKGGNIITRLKKENIIPKNVWNWFCLILKGKIKHIYYAPYFKIILLPKYLFFVL